MNIEGGPAAPDIAATKASTHQGIPDGRGPFDSTVKPHVFSTSNAGSAYSAGRGRTPTWRTPLGQFTIGLSAAQTLLVVCLEGAVLAIHNNETAWIQDVATENAPQLLGQLIPNEKAVTLYHAIYVVAQMFQFLLAVDAVVSSSTIQLICTTVFNWVLTVYAVVQYWQTRTLAHEATLELAANDITASLHWSMFEEFMIIGIMILFALGWIRLTMKLHRQFGWLIFKEMGADVATKRHLTLYHIFMMLLKVDVFFFNGFTIQYLVLVLVGNADRSTILFHACFVTPCTIPLLILAYVAIRRESKSLMTGFLLILVGGTAYVISRLVDIFTTKDPNKYLASKFSLSLFESIVVMLAIVTIVAGYLNLRIFGHGLQDQLRHRRNIKTSSEDTKSAKLNSITVKVSSLFQSDIRKEPSSMPNSIGGTNYHGCGLAPSLRK
ncbi:hypothetical protein SeMB42_g03640 [Synchytrium endobioticum]|uniref:TRP C-terminal domain-containing protein n=1 Tax=Synchytrium endobioticum TaxID=286115 RepID=A0A507D557_9FUNG|nr:hypothetical protein SeMB42_g03640 [Synchytrium endobioticum]